MVRYDLPENTNRRGSDLKISQDDYIETNIEPFDSELGADVSAEVELEMAETIYDMRREFKRQNKRMRRLYSTKQPREYKTTRGNHISKKHAIA